MQFAIRNQLSGASGAIKIDLKSAGNTHKIIVFGANSHTNTPELLFMLRSSGWLVEVVPDAYIASLEFCDGDSMEHIYSILDFLHDEYRD